MKKDYFSPELEYIKFDFERIMDQTQDVSKGEGVVDDFSEIEM